MTSHGPRRSVSQPTQGVTTAETRNANEKAPAVTPRSHPNASDLREQQGIGGASVDPNRHRHERNPDEEPSVEEQQSDVSCSGSTRISVSTSPIGCSNSTMVFFWSVERKSEPLCCYGAILIRMAGSHEILRADLIILQLTKPRQLIGLCLVH
jgi:hypothetical protein